MSGHNPIAVSTTVNSMSIHTQNPGATLMQIQSHLPVILIQKQFFL